MPDNNTSPTRDAHGGAATEPPVTRTDTDSTDNSSSALIEAPVQPGQKRPLDQHEFADGGGGGGAEAFRRKPE
ncbi:MAG: hypothetical protein H0W47_16340 [Polaromonas sp.]|uniref:hypothetical protein n=1 Tax=Polaromonas sp. TaxID=1869339 RepID=UPI0018583DBC|nr:hypothetical protein [Polaromonas sp.]MBA3595337.1 hypothetical protein [Polaromonas sp.]